MKIRKYIASFLAASLLAGASQPVGVSDTVIAAAADDGDAVTFTQGENDIFKYNIYADHIELDGIKSGSEPVVIPAEIEGLPVTDWNYNTKLSLSSSREFSIADDNMNFAVINDCLICTHSMTDIGYIGEYRLDEDTLTIPDGVKIIANSAHARDGWLKHINIPESVEVIALSAFQGSLIEELYIPKNVREIGSCALNAPYCTSLDIAEDNPWFDMVNGAVMNEEHTKLVHVACYTESDNYVIPEGVTSIDRDAFINCKKITAITVPSTYTDDYRFIEWLYYLRDIYVSKDNPEYTDVDGVMFSKDLKTLLKYPERKNEDGAYVVPEGTEKIGPLAFYFNHLNDLTFPATLKDMELYSLYTVYHYSGTMTFLNPKTPLSRCLTYFTTGYNHDTGETIYYVTVRGYKGSTAERFAESSKAKFEVIDEQPPVTTSTTTTSKTTTTTSTTLKPATSTTTTSKTTITTSTTSKPATSTTTTSKTTTTTSTTSKPATSTTTTSKTTTTTSETTTSTVNAAVKGDSNGDGDVNTADIVCMSSFLLGKKTGSVSIENSDLNGDKIIDVFDLCALRRMVIAKLSK